MWGTNQYMRAAAHRLVNRLDLLLHRQPFIGCPWVRRLCFKHSRRLIHGGIFNRNSDHQDLPPLLAERIPKRPKRGSPRVEFGIRRVARIDVGKGDGFKRSLGHPPCWSNVVVPYHIF